MEISVIQPSRNNLKYLKWSYDSIRKNQGDHVVEICVADDASTDGTWEWCQDKVNNDPNFKAIRNEGPGRLGHTILYDTLINDVSTKDIAMIYHADMYLCPKALDNIEKYIKPKVIVSLTRIEPPLHPEGPEKILKDYGLEPEAMKEKDLLEFISTSNYKDKTTEGIFAPWAFYKKDFQTINGHDPLFAPQSKEDSDIFNRLQLNGVKFIQTWEGCVYHMTCRGSRRNTLDKAKNIFEDSPEWLAQNARSTRNFIRKWGHFVMHDEYMKPIIPSKYNIGFIVKNCDTNLLANLEPWCDEIYIDCNPDVYMRSEQINTKYNLSKRIFKSSDKCNTDVTVEIDGNNFNLNYIKQLSQIIDDSGEIGEFELENMLVNIKKIVKKEKTLIVCQKS